MVSYFMTMFGFKKTFLKIFLNYFCFHYSLARKHPSSWRRTREPPKKRPYKVLPSRYDAPKVGPYFSGPMEDYSDDGSLEQLTTLAHEKAPQTKQKRGVHKNNKKRISIEETTSEEDEMSVDDKFSDSNKKPNPFITEAGKDDSSNPSEDSDNDSSSAVSDVNSSTDKMPVSITKDSLFWIMSRSLNNSETAVSMAVVSTLSLGKVHEMCCFDFLEVSQKIILNFV